MTLITESARRRTFAIISHPDAGKTTLTEKLLLYSGAIHLAGSVKSRRAARHTVSDWMKMEQERGISVSSSVLQFEHLGNALNLLDTPGHADFSEDTYRTLAAVDSALMLIDHAKGVEARTLKLFEVCRMRKLPIVTFMNKLDREGLSPFELIDEVSKTLKIDVAPVNWPIGMGKRFKGVVNIATREVHLYKTEKHGTTTLQTEVMSLEDVQPLLGETAYENLIEELDLIELAGDTFSLDRFLAGEVTPIFWGSAMTNFGVDVLLHFIAKHAAPPCQRMTESEAVIQPGDDLFTGFVFKIQANMNPKHRDRIAFVRVVSGQFNRGMDAIIGRSGETIRLSKPHSFVAQERAIVEQAWPGDIIGLYDSGKLRIGDTLAVKKRIQFGGIPRFAPAFFGQMIPKDPLKRKALDTGLSQLAYEGVIQLFYRPNSGKSDPILGAVGILQFEVLKERLKNEYKVEAQFNSLSYTTARWIQGPREATEWFKKRREYHIYEDRNGNSVLLTESAWSIRYAEENATDIQLHDIEPL